MLPDDLLTSADLKHDVEQCPCVLEQYPTDDCLNVLSPSHLFLLKPPEELNTMNMSDDEPSSGLNGRLRPRKSAVQSPQTTKPLRRSESRSSQERPKRTSTPSKVLNKTDDLANKSDSSSIPHYLCPFCDKKFAAKQAISKHVHRMHSKQAPFMGCLFCNHAEAEHNDIIRHMVDSHPNQYFACLDCHTRFSSTTELAEHKLNVCEKQKLPYRNKLRQKSGKSKKSQKTIKIDDKDFETNSKTFPAGHGFNGIVISCELKPSQVHDDADIEDNITTNLILPPSKTLGSNAVLDKNAVIVLDDIQWNKRIPSNFSFHNTDADQILSRLGVVHRSPRTGESTRRDWLRTIDDATQKFEKCFDTSFYSKVASNVQENLTKFLDGSFNFNPDPDSMIKTRKSKMSVVINTAEGFPILLACEQYSRNTFDGYMPRAIAPRHKWKWDSLETDRTALSPDQIKRDSHTNNCIITLVSSLDIWTQLCMRRKYEEKYSYTPLAKKTDKQTAIENELKEILESREIPTSSSQVVKYKYKPPTQNDAQDFPAFLGLAPSTPKYEVPPAVLSGEWVRPRCYVCCACGTPTYDSRALSAHMATRHPNAQVQHYEVVGELLLNADILKHLYVPPSQMHNRTRPLRGIRECTKCKKSITLEDLHQHMLDCAGDTPAVRRKCRYRPFGVRKRRPRLPDNRIRKKMRKDIRNRQSNQKAHMRARTRTNRSEVGDAETIRKMLADLPAKRHRVLVNPMNSMMRPRRKLEKHRNKLLMKRRQSEETKNRNRRTIKTNNEHSSSSNEVRNSSPSLKFDDDDDKPLKRPMRRVPAKGTRQSEAMKRRAVLNRARRKLDAATEQASVDNEAPDLDVPKTSCVEINQLSIENNSQRIDVNSGSYNSRENSNRGSNGGDDGSNNREQPPPGNIDQNGNSNNQPSPAQNTPLKHSIARLTADCESHDKTIQFHQAYVIEQECNNLNQHGTSGQRLSFENEAAVTKLDKPPLAHGHHIEDPGNIQKRKQNKVKRLNDCIAMLKKKNKLSDPGSEETTSQSVQCSSEESLERAPPSQTPIEDKPAEIFHRHDINDLAMDRQFERPYEYSQEGKFIPRMNHPIPIPYEMIPMIMSMPQPEDLRVMQPMETPSKPKTRRSSTRVQQRRTSRPTMDTIPPMSPFMIPGNPYEVPMVPPMPHPGQISQRRSSSQRIIVNINTETNRPPSLDLPSPNRLSPRQVSPRQISPRQMMINAEMMRDMSYERPSPNKLSPLQIVTPDVRARSESRSPRSHVYDPQVASRVGHRQVSPRHSLDFDPRRVAIELFQHSSQPSAPTQISPRQVSQHHEKYSLYANKFPPMPSSYRQTSPAPDHKGPKQISPMQETIPFDFHSAYKAPKQVSPRQVNQPFDTHANKLPSPVQGPKHISGSVDSKLADKITSPDLRSTKLSDRALDSHSSKAASIGKDSSNQASQPLDLQLSTKISPPLAQTSSKQAIQAVNMTNMAATSMHDSSKHPSQVSDTVVLCDKVPSALDFSSKETVTASETNASTRMPPPDQESSKLASHALDLQLSKKIGVSSRDKADQDLDLNSSNMVPSQVTDTTAEIHPSSNLPLTGQGALIITSDDTDLLPSNKLSVSDDIPNKPDGKTSEKHSTIKTTLSAEESTLIKRASDSRVSDKLAQKPPKQISQATDKQPSMMLAQKSVAPKEESKVVELQSLNKLPVSQVYDAQTHRDSSSLVLPKPADQTAKAQTASKSTPKDVLVKQPAPPQAKEIKMKSTKSGQKDQSSNNAKQSAPLKVERIDELQPKTKTRASSRSSQRQATQTRATRASSRALRLRSSSQREDSDQQSQEPQSETREPNVQTQHIKQTQSRARELLDDMPDPQAQTREPYPKIRDHRTHESDPEMKEDHNEDREFIIQKRESQPVVRKPQECKPLEQLKRDPLPQSRENHSQVKEHQPQAHESLPWMKDPQHQAKESLPQVKEPQFRTKDPHRQVNERHLQAKEPLPQVKERQPQAKERQLQAKERQPRGKEPQHKEKEPQPQMEDHQPQVKDHQAQVKLSQLQAEDRQPHAKERQPCTVKPQPQANEPQLQMEDHQPRVKDHQPQVKDPQPQAKDPQLQAKESQPKAKECQPGMKEPQPQEKKSLPQAKEPQLQVNDHHTLVKDTQSQAKERQSGIKGPQVKSKEPHLQVKDHQTQVKDPLPQAKECQPQAKERQPGMKKPQTQAKEPQPQAKEHQPQVKESQPQAKERQSRMKEPQPQAKEPQPQVIELQPRVKQPQTRAKESQPQPKETQAHTKESQSQAKAPLTQAKEHQPQTKEPLPQKGKRHTRESQPGESKMREPQMHETDLQIRETRKRATRESHLQPQETQPPVREHQAEKQGSQMRETTHRSREPHPHMREPFPHLREPHVPVQDHVQMQESHAHSQPNAHPQTRESRTRIRESHAQLQEPQTQRQDTQTRESHTQQTRVTHTQSREPHVQAQHPAESRDSQAQSKHHDQPREARPQNQEPLAQTREQSQLGKPEDTNIPQREEQSKPRESLTQPQPHHHLRGPLTLQEPQPPNRESRSQSRNLYIQQRDSNIQMQHHANLQEPSQPRDTHIGMREHHIQGRETQSQETHPQTQSQTQLQKPHLQSREIHVQLQESQIQPRESFMETREHYSPPQELSLQQHSQTRDPRVKVQETHTLTRVSHAKTQRHDQPREEINQHREPHTQLCDLSQPRDSETLLRGSHAQQNAVQLHNQSLASHTQLQRDLYSHAQTLDQSQSQGPSRPYLIFAPPPPPPPPPPEETQHSITQLQLEAQQQQWKPNVFDMTMIRQSSIDAANEQLARNMAVEIYQENEYPHMHPGIPLAHTGNLLDNLPSVPLDLSSKTPETCENARKLETSYVSHYERYETLDLSNKNTSLQKRDDNVVVDLRVKPNSQSSSMGLHELSGMAMNMDEIVDIHDLVPRDLSVKQKHLDVRNMTNDQAYEVQDFSNKSTEIPTDLSGKMIPVSSHFLSNNNDNRQLLMTDQFSHNAKERVPLVTNIDKHLEAANDFSENCRNNIPSNLLSNIFIPPPPPPPPPQDDIQTDEIDNTTQKEIHESSLKIPEYKLKISNTPDLEESSEDFGAQISKTLPDVHATVSVNTSITNSPDYTSPKFASAAQARSRSDAEYALAKVFMSVSNKTGTEDVGTESLISRFSCSIPTTTIASTSSVYTLASSSRSAPSDSGKSSQGICENTSETERQINKEQDPETARKIALLPKELVEILGNMPPDHRNQLLNVLPQYVSHTNSSDQSNTNKQVDDSRSTTDLSKIPLPAGSGPSTTFVQNDPVSKFESPLNYQNPIVSMPSDNRFSIANLSPSKLNENLDSDIKHHFSLSSLPPLLCAVNKTDDVKPAICGKITISENKIEVINLETSETTTEVYNNPKVIDLTEDDTLPANPIVNIIKTPEGLSPNIVVTPTILPTVQLGNVTKVKTSNEKTSSLRAVRIKTPSERHKSVSTDVQVTKNISENDSLILDDNDLALGKALAIQQYEVSSTQQQKKDAVKLSPTVTELSTEATKPVQHDTPAEQQEIQSEIENNSKGTKAVLVTSSISTSGLLVDKQSLNKIISSDLQVNLTPCDLNKTILIENQKVKVTLTDESIQSTCPLIKDSTDAKTNATLQEEDEDSDDDISLAVIVKQKQLDQHISIKSDILEIKQNSDKKKWRKEKRTKKTGNKYLEKDVRKETSESCNSSEPVDKALTGDNERDKIRNNKDSSSVNDSSKINILTEDEVKYCKKKIKNSGHGKKISGTTTTNMIDSQQQDLQKTSFEHKNVSSSSIKTCESGGEMNVTDEVSPEALEDERSEIVYSVKKNKSKKKLVPKLSQSPLPISPLKTKKSVIDYDCASVEKDQDEIRYDCKRIVEPDSCSIIELSDTQDSLIQDSVNAEESNSESITESKKHKKNTRLNKSKMIECSNDIEQSTRVIDNLVTPLRRSRRGKSLYVDKLSDAEGITQESDIFMEQKAPLTKKQLIFSKLLLDEENTKPQAVLAQEKYHGEPENDSNVVQTPEKVASNLSDSLDKSKLIEMDVVDDFSDKNKCNEVESSKKIEQNTSNDLQTPENNLVKIDHDVGTTHKISVKGSCPEVSKTQRVLEKDAENETEVTKQASEKNKAIKRRQSPQVKRKVKKPKSAESSEHTLEDMDTSSSLQQAADSESEKINTNLNTTKSKNDTSVKINPNEVTNEPVNIDNKSKRDTNKPSSSAEKRKNSEYIETHQVTKNKKYKFGNKETNSKGDLSEHNKTINYKNVTQDKKAISASTEVRATCYRPVAARRTRSKSAVVKSSAEMLYDPYDIDFDDMIQRNEPVLSKKGKSLATKTGHSYSLASTSTPIKHATTKSQKKAPIASEDETLHDKDFGVVEDELMDERGNISDSDDSTKSDVPLQKYVEEKGKRISAISPSKELDDDTDIEQELSGDKNNSNDSKSSRKTLAVCNSVEGGAGQNETEEQLRSEQFMESFGFFSERKPRKSNLLASKKISETFHIIANESDDVYFGYKDRSSKKLQYDNKKSDEAKNSKGNKKEAKRGRKKKSCVKPEPCYCHICKKEFKRPDNFLRHQMSLIHISKLSEVELKVKTLPIHEEPNYLIAYKQYLDRLKVLTDKLAKKKKHKGSRKIKLPTVEEILADLNKTIREQQFSQRGLSNDEALFLDCCELLQEMPIKNDKPSTDATALANACQSDMQIEKNLDDMKSDGDVDSITAKTILESEEVRNLENDLISNLKEAASANAAKSKLKYQQSLAVEPPQEPVGTSPNLTEAHYDQVKVIEIVEKPEKPEKPVPEKSKREREILVDEKEFVYKEKMYPDIIEDIDMFEDKFDKIKRKCRSQAAAAKQTQVVAEPSESHKSRRKLDKKKGKKTKKGHQSSHVPTKGALKGFDGVKVSISSNDINMTNIAPSSADEKTKDSVKDQEKDKEKDREQEPEKDRDEDQDKNPGKDPDKDREKEREKDKEKKKKKKGSSKKKRDKKDSESSSKCDSDQKSKESSTQKKVDVYEFMDNEDAELFEFRPSTLMERFKTLSKDTPSTSKSNLVADEVDISSDSASDGDDFVYMSDDYVCSDDETENSLLSCEMGTVKVGKEKTSSPLKRKDVVEKNAVMGKIFKHNAVRSEKKIVKAKESGKPKANLDQLFDSLLEDEPSKSTAKGDSSPQKDQSEAESYSSLPGSTYEPSSSKYEPPSRYEPSSSKFERSPSRNEPTCSKYESSMSKPEQKGSKFETSHSSSFPSTSKSIESTPSTSRYESIASRPSTSKHEASTSRYDALTVTTRDSPDKEFALPQKITPSHRYESMPSTSKRPQRPSLQAEEFRFSPRKYDSTDEVHGPSTSKRLESSASDVDYSSGTTKKYDMKSPKECKLLSPKKYDSRKYETVTSKTNDCNTSRYSSSSMRNEDGSFKRRYSLDKSPRKKSDEDISSTYDYGGDVFEDEAGVARQRARRKCTVGKQNVLAESWSSESEPERGPPRPTSAESVLSTGGRKKKGRKKEGQPLGGRRGKLSFKRQEFESRVSSSNRNSSSSAAGCVDGRSYEEYGSGASSSVSTGVQVSLGPPSHPGPSGVKPRARPAPYAWPDGDDDQEHLQQHGWIVGDSHKKLVTMLAHAKGRKRNNDDKRHLVE